MAEEPMDGAELRAICERWGWSLATLERLFCVAHTTVTRWSFDRLRIPLTVAAWLRKADRWLEKNPPPDAPKREFPPR